jgi:hypothetical protein
LIREASIGCHGREVAGSTGQSSHRFLDPVVAPVSAQRDAGRSMKRSAQMKGADADGASQLVEIEVHVLVQQFPRFIHDPPRAAALESERRSASFDEVLQKVRGKADGLLLNPKAMQATSGPRQKRAVCHFE